MAKAKGINLDPYRQFFVDGKPLEDIAKVSGATIEEVTAYANALKVPNAHPGDAQEPPHDEPTGDVDTSDLHEPPVNDDRADLVSVIAALQAEAREQSKRADRAEERADRLEADLSTMRRDFLAGLEAIRAGQAGLPAAKADRGECPTAVKVICDSVTIKDGKGGVYVQKRGDVLSCGLNGEWIVAALWGRGPTVCERFPKS
jgi:hypothetical protein